MSRLSDMFTGLDAHAFLVAFCALAEELYPELDWAAVEPKLQRSWERYQGDDRCRWEDVRETARVRWEARGNPSL